MTVLDLDPPPAALNRRVAIAQSATGQARRDADLPLAWRNADACGRVDFRDLWMVDKAELTKVPAIRRIAGMSAEGICDDILSVPRLIVLRQGHPDAYGLREPFEQWSRTGDHSS